MANMASVAYAIEGNKESLEKIKDAILKAILQKEHWGDEWKACINLGFTEKELDDKRLGGQIPEEPDLIDGVLKFYAEERWGLQDFNELLIQKFPDINVYWIVEECGCEVYCTNDEEGKYFPQRYWVDTAQDDVYASEYFNDEKSMWEWLNKKYGVKSMEEVEAWNANYEETGNECENFIYIHEFTIEGNND